jgi:prepilin-type N-terminal cleavage/methylation domain-containing protein/prepilin-type processing-associated H-X9-DG protein
MDQMSRRFLKGREGFTLVELLVVVAIIAVLAALLAPIFQNSIAASRRAACISNLRQIGVGIAAYAADNDGVIPYGPKAPPFSNPLDFYPSTGAPTSLLSTQNGAPVGLGLLVKTYLAKTPKVFFCPGADQPLNSDAQLAKVGVGQAQSSYYYRHGGNTSLFDPNGVAPQPQNVHLANLGLNSQGVPIRALVMDSEFLTLPDFAGFGIVNVTNHQGLWVNVLYSDGHVTQHPNGNQAFTINDTDYGALDATFGVILSVFEKADATP